MRLFLILLNMSNGENQKRSVCEELRSWKVFLRECAHCSFFNIFFLREWSECGENVKSWVQAVNWTVERRSFSIYFQCCVFYTYDQKTNSPLYWTHRWDWNFFFIFRKTQRTYNKRAKQEKKFVQFKLECYSEAKREAWSSRE